MKDIKSSVNHFQKYVGTYRDQAYWETYPIETYINDMLYGLGISIDRKYRFAGGYEKFKKYLLKNYLKER
jgi:hypothetical protein